jgi:hypothetical protein
MKLKLIAAALAFAAAGSAQAQVANSQKDSPLPELYFTAWYAGDATTTTDDTSYSRDLGSALTSVAGDPVGNILNWVGDTPDSSFAAGGRIELNGNKTSAGYMAVFAADDNLNGWLAGFSAEQKATIRWNVTSAASYDTHNILTTAKDITSGQVPKYPALRNAVGAWDSHLSEVNNDDEQGTGAGSDLSSTVLGGTNPAYSGATFGAKWNGKVTFDSSALLGEEMNFYSLWAYAATGGTSTAAGLQQFVCLSGACDANDMAAKWSFAADGTLSYAVAAVPEPETYALLLAGLGLVGAVARRRKAA